MATQLTGMAVTLTTGSTVQDAGTDDPLYVGVFGDGGGREFPLATTDEEDFITGTIEKFALGVIWEGGFSGPDIKFPEASAQGEFNDPARVPLDLDLVKFVYLRKEGAILRDNDDAYQLRALDVVLYGPASPSKTTYRYIGDKSVLLGTEFGQVIYLQLVRDPIL